MNNPFYILVGAKPPVDKASNPGGQLSMSIGLCDYVLSQGNNIEVIDTLQDSFPLPPFYARLKRGGRRMAQLLRLLNTRQVKGVIIFSAEGFSFYERILMAGMCRLYCVQSVFFMLSGFFVNDMQRSWVARSVARALLRLPTVIGIQGDAWRPFYKKLGVQSARLITIMNWSPHGFLTERHSIKLGDNQLMRFCFVGWLVKEKGVVELFDAIKILAAHYAFEFVFVGGGTLQVELNEKIIESNLTERVMVTGWCEADEVKAYLNDSHVFVLPSKAEGFPISLLEAMSLGLPSICTNVGAIGDSLKDGVNGYLLSDGSSESIAEAMKRYLIEPELIARHSVAALETVKLQHNRDENCRLLFDQFH